MGHHPVKKRSLASVTKCQNCNGSGIIFIGGNKNKLNQSNADKPFHCNICGGSFSRYSSLWSHKKLHSGEKNFKCGICGIAFAKAVYLKNHSRIHTGEKPYRWVFVTSFFYLFKVDVPICIACSSREMRVNSGFYLGSGICTGRNGKGYIKWSKYCT